MPHIKSSRDLSKSSFIRWIVYYKFFSKFIYKLFILSNLHVRKVQCVQKKKKKKKTERKEKKNFVLNLTTLPVRKF